jgi:hypothetical protein
MALTAHSLLSKSKEQLEALFDNAPAGPIPDGTADGIAIVAPGTIFTSEIAEAINIFAWQGKVFDLKKAVLVNRVTVFGIDAILATIRKDASWVDGKECIVLDYSKTSIVAHHIRDEIRLIGPGLYLGIVFWDKTRLIHFALQFPQHQ